MDAGTMKKIEESFCSTRICDGTNCPFSSKYNPGRSICHGKLRGDAYVVASTASISAWFEQTKISTELKTYLQLSGVYNAFVKCILSEVAWV